MGGKFRVAYASLSECICKCEIHDKATCTETHTEHVEETSPYTAVLVNMAILLIVHSV